MSGKTRYKLREGEYWGYIHPGTLLSTHAHWENKLLVCKRDSEDSEYIRFFDPEQDVNFASDWCAHALDVIRPLDAFDLAVLVNTGKPRYKP